jgi:DUF4097 and DUF4098 domain-containing protein YvlB
MTPITERFALSGSTANLVVTIPSGTVRLTESSDASVSVEVEGKGADQILISAVGDDITISYKEQERRFFGISGSVVIRVQLPAGSDLRLNTASANVSSDVDLGEVKCNTASGDLRLSNIGGGLEVKSASGDVQAKTVQGTLKASLASGDVRAKKVKGTLHVNTASGNVRVREALGDVRVKSASGDVHVERWSGEDFAAKTVSGDVTLTVPVGTRAELSLRSMSGSIRMPDGPSSHKGAERVQRKLSFTSVSGDFSLKVEA